MSNNTGGAAFPYAALHGMTLRDYFAAKALPLTYQYWMTDYYHPDAVDAEIRAEEIREGLTTLMDVLAESAYAMADAMLEARQT